MNEYELIRMEFEELEEAGTLVEKRAIEVRMVHCGSHFTLMAEGAREDLGFDFPQVEEWDPAESDQWVSTYRRPDDNSVIAQLPYAHGAVSGCARYYNRQGDLVGEENWSVSGEVYIITEYVNPAP